MAEICPDCGRPVTADDDHAGSESLCVQTDSAGNYLVSNCAEFTVRRLRAQLASARAELARIKGKRFPVLDGGATVPWQMLAPHEPQARSNHSQTLQRLAERGGLGWSEMLAVLEGQGLRFVSATPDEAAKPRVLEWVRRYESGLLPEPPKASET